MEFNKSKSLKFSLLTSIDEAEMLKDTNKVKFLNRIYKNLKPLLDKVEYSLILNRMNDEENKIINEYLQLEMNKKNKNIVKYSRKGKKDLLEIESHELAILNYLIKSVYG